MDDQQIIDLFFDRSEIALEAVKAKYGSRAQQLAGNLLRSKEDGEECVNDALLVLWERIPPERPRFLWAYFSRILRNICCCRLDHLCAAKRDRGKELCLEELESCFVNLRDPQQLVEAQEISQIINLFLDGLDEIGRRIFVRRYYYFDSCAENSYEIEVLE